MKKERSILDDHKYESEPIQQPPGVPEFHMRIDIPSDTHSWEIKRSLFDRRVVICYSRHKLPLAKISLGPIIQIVDEKREEDTLVITYCNELTDSSKGQTGGVVTSKVRPRINGRRI